MNAYHVLRAGWVAPILFSQISLACIVLLGCGVDSGGSPSEPTVCDTDSCDLDVNDAYTCICDVNQDGDFCDPFDAAAQSRTEAQWCSSLCESSPANANTACFNLCDDADNNSGLGHFDYDSTPIMCAVYPNSGSCTSWSPSSHVSLSGGVYHVNASWLAGVVANPAPLWTCDDATLDGQAVNGFRVNGASTGELLYVLGLRNNDLPIAINGKGLNNYHQAIVAAGFLYFSGVTSYTLVVNRGGTNISLSYELV